MFRCRFYCLGILLGYSNCSSSIKKRKLSLFWTHFRYVIFGRLYLKLWAKLLTLRSKLHILNRRIFNLMHSWYGEALFYSVPRVSTLPCQFIYTLHMTFFITMLYNSYVGWYWTKEAVSGTYSQVQREWSFRQYPTHCTKPYRSHK
jgi:hypothetical protein